MNWKTILAAGLLLVPVHISGVLAGFEPSPFQPEINQLGAVANILSSADIRVFKTMAHPPDPCVPPDPCFPPDPCYPPDPCKGLNGVVNRLEAIDNQIGSTKNMILSMINEVMGVEPTPFRDDLIDLIPPLEVVRAVAEGIVVRIVEYNPTGPVAPEFTEALGNVADSAFNLMDTVDKSVIRLSEPMACEDYDTVEACSAAGCLWDIGVDECFPLDS